MYLLIFIMVNAIAGLTALVVAYLLFSKKLYGLLGVYLWFLVMTVIHYGFDWPYQVLFYLTS